MAPLAEVDADEPGASPPTEEEAREVAAIMQQFVKPGDFTAAYRLVEGQLTVLHTRGQSITQLAGVVITVTGFSGRIIADTNDLAQGLIIAGLFLVLSAAAICLGRVMPIRWVSSYMHLPVEQFLLVAIRRRNRKDRAFHLAVVILCIGMFLYVSSISLMLAYPEMTEVKLVR